MSKGFTGKIIKVNLSTGKIKRHILREPFYKVWLGGYGLGAKIIYSEISPKTDPLGPGNILGFTTGILTGTGTPSSSSFTVVGKSPLTHTWGDSRCGGFLGPELKKAGFDAVFFHGKAKKPTYLSIINGHVGISDASHLWGKDTYETEEIIKKDHGKERFQIACIGTAGEKMSKISSIIHDKGRAAGRSGLGAVMGAKKLKAIAVRGTRKVAVLNSRKLFDLTREWLKTNKENPEFVNFSKYGTMRAVEALSLTGDSPCKNWLGYGGRDFPTANKISDDEVMRYQYKNYACWGCSVACSGIVEVKTCKYSVKCHKPEYQTLAAFGTLCLNDDVEAIIIANNICNRYGIDTISTGTVIAFAMECYEKGIISKSDTDGIELNWGNAQAIVEMTEKIARREGLGNILADGVKVASKRIGKGSENCAMHVGGQEIPMHDPKYAPGLATTYVCDATPGRHTQYAEWMEGTAYRVPGIDMPMVTQYTPSSRSKKRAIAHAIAQNHSHVINALGVCQVPTWFPKDAPRYEEFVNVVTGWKFTGHDLLQCGERIACIRQAFNVREGFVPSDFKLPGRVIGDPPLKYGPLKDITIDVESQARRYFKVMDWDYKTGKPSRKRLLQLGLEDVANNLFG